MKGRECACITIMMIPAITARPSAINAKTSNARESLPVWTTRMSHEMTVIVEKERRNEERRERKQPKKERKRERKGVICDNLMNLVQFPRFPVQKSCR